MNVGSGVIERSYLYLKCNKKFKVSGGSPHDSQSTRRFNVFRYFLFRVANYRVFNMCRCRAAVSLLGLPNKPRSVAALQARLSRHYLQNLY
jgi:hypothetical protein